MNKPSIVSAAQSTPGPQSREQRMVLSATNQCALDGRPVRSLLWGRGYAIDSYDGVLVNNMQQRAQRICPACDLPPISDCKFANCKREFAVIAQATGGAA